METQSAGTDPAQSGAETELGVLPRLCRRLTEESLLPMVAVEGGSHRVSYANAAFCRLSGLASEDLMNRPFAEAVPEGEENGCIRLLDRVLATGKPEILLEQEHSNIASHSVYWSYSAWFVRNGEKRPGGVVFQVTDATETVLYRKQVVAMNEELLLAGMRQHALRESAEQLNIRLQQSIKETHHRVKNNLQVVIALAEMQFIDDSSMLPASALHRIAMHARTLAELHDLLTQRVQLNIDEDKIPTQIILERVIFLLQPSFGNRRIQYTIAPTLLPMNQSTALSLLVSELVSNAFKHGQNDISVSFQHRDREAILTVTDQGAGFPPNFDARTAANTGLDLIMSMAQHDLRGDVEFTNSADGGACVTVKFPVARQS